MLDTEAKKAARAEWLKEYNARPDTPIKRRAYYAFKSLDAVVVERRRLVGRQKQLSLKNITEDQYQSLLREQNGVCTLCGEPERIVTKSGAVRLLAIDHDHSCCPGKKSCGKCVRGLLCYTCNIRLGELENRIASGWLKRAITYLEGGDL